MGIEIRFYINRTGKKWDTEKDLPQFTAYPADFPDPAGFTEAFCRYIEDNCLLTLWNCFPIADKLRSNPAIKQTGNHFFGELTQMKYAELADYCKQTSVNLDQIARQLHKNEPDWTKERVYIWIL